MSNDDPNDVDLKLNLTMHPTDTITLQTKALGMKPAVLVEMEDDGDCVYIDVHVYGIGTDLDDVKGVGEILEVVSKGIADKAESAYEVRQVEED